MSKVQNGIGLLVGAALIGGVVWYMQPEKIAAREAAAVEREAANEHEARAERYAEIQRRQEQLMEQRRAKAAKSKECREGHQADWSKIDAALAAGDDVARYRTRQRDATLRLVCNMDCPLSAISYWGGWARSSNRGQGIYFTYCRMDAAEANRYRYYLNVNTGALTR